MTRERVKEIIDESLRDWFKKERAASARKKKAGGKKGKQFVKNTKKASYKKGTYQSKK